VIVVVVMETRQFKLRPARARSGIRLFNHFRLLARFGSPFNFWLGLRKRGIIQVRINTFASDNIKNPNRAVLVHHSD
jgi:hypothetical protein